jgi:SPP1 family predicted phage head-tail adaptor
MPRKNARTGRAKRLKSHELRDPIVIVKSSEVPDDMHGYDETLQKHGNIWAKFIPAKRNLFSETNDDEKVQEHKFLIRRDDSVVLDKTHLILHEGRVYRIRATKESCDLEETITIYCVENGMLKDRDVTIGEDEPRIVPNYSDDNDLWF